MSSNLKVNKRSQKSFSVTRFSGFDGSRVQITTARDHRKEISVSDKFFDSVNLNKQEIKENNNLFVYLNLLFLLKNYLQIIYQ